MAQSGHLGHELTLDLAESGFTVLRENLRDGLAGASLNPFVGIDELVAKLSGGKAPDSRLPRAHETNEREVVNLSFACHGNRLAASLRLAQDCLRMTASSKTLSALSRRSSGAIPDRAGKACRPRRPDASRCGLSGYAV